MNKQDFVRKIASRKFWACVAGFVAGLVIACRGSASTAETISGLITSFGTLVVYILGESAVDAAHKPLNGADEHVEPPPDVEDAR